MYYEGFDQEISTTQQRSVLRFLANPSLIWVDG